MPDADGPDHNRSRADRRAVPHDNPLELPFPRSDKSLVRGGDGVLVIGEHHAMADEHAVPERDPFADERVTLDLAKPTDTHARLDLDKRTNLRIRTNTATIEIGEAVNDDALAEFHMVQDPPRRFI
jgi:hypothetical protein